MTRSANMETPFWASCTVAWKERDHASGYIWQHESTGIGNPKRPKQSPYKGLKIRTGLSGYIMHLSV